jgi:hypothetical protein
MNVAEKEKVKGLHIVPKLFKVMVLELVLCIC